MLVSLAHYFESLVYKIGLKKGAKNTKNMSSKIKDVH
jgi:hypothetical protein